MYTLKNALNMGFFYLFCIARNYIFMHSSYNVFQLLYPEITLQTIYNTVIWHKSKSEISLACEGSLYKKNQTSQLTLCLLLLRALDLRSSSILLSSINLDSLLRFSKYLLQAPMDTKSDTSICDRPFQPIVILSLGREILVMKRAVQESFMKCGPRRFPEPAIKT